MRSFELDEDKFGTPTGITDWDDEEEEPNYDGGDEI
jgi:hypothetical protein